ncbi:hypothetical protein ASPWEDRAFT_40446 [Aspergillus wentii DTO 134E9]|uniref:HIG1 domain-containing protein n=1 Tax=Aspergillus wentii DTO 134E9 TaxID=1073089 RepID=A0A1L9RK01_ASPWE|nr:uncharacterized protein ASPWEDRAFT_40446 [Aspergillus wentii DTO 134E9]KAI9923602.1 hypothetical protein MW887_008524 [Aspergillus wentii]OJJ35260.1 hypothetical protein ASPWEDRAFT_40446 [Aspergillus wentii DTO 134E9]
MKLLTKEEEEAHYKSVLKGGTFGTILGCIGGAAGVMAATKRYQTIRNLTLPMKSFLVTSSGTFVGIIAADHASRDFEKQRNQERLWYENRETRLREEELSHMSFTDRALAFAREERYKIVGVTWVASMIGSFALVGRNPYLTGQQKIVQARVYAQGLTLAVLCASAAFEISDQRKGRGLVEAARKNKEAAKKAAEVTPQGTEEGDLWKDMVAAEETRLKKKHQSLYENHAATKSQEKSQEAPREEAAEKSQPKEEEEEKSSQKEEDKESEKQN